MLPYTGNFSPPCVPRTQLILQKLRSCAASVTRYGRGPVVGSRRKFSKRRTRFLGSPGPDLGARQVNTIAWSPGGSVKVRTYGSGRRLTATVSAKNGDPILSGAVSSCSVERLALRVRRLGLEEEL